MTFPKTPATERPSFGTILRAYRQRYAWAVMHGCFVRIKDVPADTWLVEVAPLEIRFLAKGEGEYRVLDNADAVMDASPILRAVWNPKGQHEFVLDEKGEIAK